MKFQSFEETLICIFMFPSRNNIFISLLKVFPVLFSFQIKRPDSLRKKVEKIYYWLIKVIYMQTVINIVAWFLDQRFFTNIDYVHTSLNSKGSVDNVTIKQYQSKISLSLFDFSTLWLMKIFQFIHVTGWIPEEFNVYNIFYRSILFYIRT